MSYTADVREGIQWPTVAEDESAPKIPLRFIEPAKASRQEPGLMLVCATYAV